MTVSPSSAARFVRRHEVRRAAVQRPNVGAIEADEVIHAESVVEIRACRGAHAEPLEIVLPRLVPVVGRQSPLLARLAERIGGVPTEASSRKSCRRLHTSALSSVTMNGQSPTISIPPCVDALSIAAPRSIARTDRTAFPATRSRASDSADGSRSRSSPGHSVHGALAGLCAQRAIEAYSSSHHDSCAMYERKAAAFAVSSRHSVRGTARTTPAAHAFSARAPDGNRPSARAARARSPRPSRARTRAVVHHPDADELRVDRHGAERRVRRRLDGASSFSGRICSTD